MAVLTDWQKKGMGSMLIKEGIGHCQKAGYAAVVVLGRPDYYSRFGFAPSVKYGIISQYDVPDKVLMLKELNEGV